MSYHRRFFIEPDKIRGDIVNITGDLVTQIRRVLRLKKGDWVQLLDGCGTEYEAQIVDCANGALQARITDRRKCETEPACKLTMAVALPKADKLDMIVQKCTELGMSRLVVFVAERSVPRIEGSRVAGKLNRWRRIAIEAAEQSGRGLVPQIEGIIKYNELLNTIPQYDLPLFAWEGGDALPLRDVLRNYECPGSAIVIIGPEGGFAPWEAESLRDGGAVPVSLGKRILRCETAAIAACAILMSEYGDTT
ncbi:MAG: RsmE family RNA methyltransferase [Armatimonadota bacterium]